MTRRDATVILPVNRPLTRTKAPRHSTSATIVLRIAESRHAKNVVFRIISSWISQNVGLHYADRKRAQ